MTLLELLAVLAVVGVLLAVGARAVDGIFQGVGRRGAVQRVMGMFEQARARALASGNAIYIAFADESFPPELRWKALALYEEDADVTVPLKALTPWSTLPGRMSFAGAWVGATATEAPPQEERRLFLLPDGERMLPYVKFNAAGGVDYPRHVGGVRVYLGWNGEEPSAAEGLEMIRIARYTGRVTFHAGRGVEPEIGVAAGKGPAEGLSAF